MAIDTNTHSLAGSVLPEAAAPAAGTQPQPAQAPHAKAKPSAQAARQARERLVLMSMGLVTAASAGTLYTVLGYSLAESVLGGGGVWAALMTAHQHMKNNAEIVRLKAEIQKLESLRGDAGDAARGSRGATSHAPSANGTQSNARWERAPRPAGGRPASPGAPRRGPADSPSGPPPVVETALWPGTALSAADPMRDQWAFRPRESGEPQPLPPVAPDVAHVMSGGPAPNSIESDLAMVQRKIKALADEVNAADSERERAPSPAQSSALEASIGELKATAEHMRTGRGSQPHLDHALPSGPSLSDAPEPMPLPQGQALPFELLIPATAERIAVSQPADLAQTTPEPRLPELSSVPQSAFGLPELPTLPELSFPAQPDVPPRNPRLAAIVDALENGEMDVYLSPIVALQSHQVSHYDVTVRLKAASGNYIDNAEQELQLAGSDVLALFDTARLKRAATLAQRLDAHNKSGSLLSAVNGPSITNAEFLETFARVFEERDRISNQLVLTFTQADLEQFTPSAWQALGDMQAFGFRFALSQIDHVAMDFAALAQRGFAFLRLEARALMNGLPGRDRFVEADELCRYLAGAGMTLVADTIDDEAIRARVFGFGVLFGQGRLFGGARQIKLDQLPKGSAAAA